jgi:4-nitrophenyl phosphatase
MATAAALIRKGARFIGTNPDLTLPTPSGPAPGAGVVLAAISAACGVEPTIVGKPEPLMFQQALAWLGTEPERTAVVGDRLETDILGGKNAGVRTILVLSGVTNEELLAGSPIRPDWVFDDIGALSTALEK